MLKIIGLAGRHHKTVTGKQVFCPIFGCGIFLSGRKREAV
ncbi:hypothetical protein HMPREF9120_00240 [Neisseria sp. oral taxon 020 str. F0370]|nr:hypothetical protein HMPREF9120_00240 [Neisseria sp. oral taxon 020 str. F0370]